MNETRRTLQAALVALGLVGLLVLVALGARAGHPFGTARVHQREVPARVGNDLFTLLVILYGLAAVVVIVAFLTLRREEWSPVKSNWIRNTFVSLAVLCSLSFIGYEFARIAHHRSHARTPASQVRGRGGGRTPTLPNLPAAKKPARFDWEFAVVFVGLAVLTAAYFAARARREEEPEPELEPRELEEVLARVVRETIDDLRGEADPRRAVIAAYARMEGILARHGYGRRPSEAPYEYLERVLVELRVAPDAVRELTDLFELAKFSPHRIGDDVRDRALAAFVSIRDDLKAAVA